MFGALKSMFRRQVGYYKIHPEIPSEMSQKARGFILRCFIPEPEMRATAAELLEDPFLCEWVTMASNSHSQSIQNQFRHQVSLDKSYLYEA